MQIRFTTDPPRIEWKEKVADRWVGRTVSVTPENLERFGVSAPANGPVTTWHAKRLLAALQRERRVSNAPKPLMTLAGLIDVYLSNLFATKGTIERRERVLRRAAKKPAGTQPKAANISLLSFVGDVPLRSITSETLLRYQNSLQAADYSPMTVRDYLLDVRHLLNYAVRHGYLETSPAAELRIPASEPNEDIRILTKEQIAALLALAGDPLTYDPTRHKHMERETGGRRPFKRTPGNSILSKVLPGFVYLGLRRSELVKLQWEDVDLGRRVVLVRGAKKNPAKRERRRAVPIPDPLYEILKKMPRTSAFVFTNTRGEPWNVDSLHSGLCRFRQTWKKKLGFDFDYQTLRRSYGSLLYEAGYSLDQIAEFLGHSDIKTTRTWYARLRAEAHHAKVSKAFALAAAAETG